MAAPTSVDSPAIVLVDPPSFATKYGKAVIFALGIISLLGGMYLIGNYGTVRPPFFIAACGFSVIGTGAIAWMIFSATQTEFYSEEKKGAQPLEFPRKQLQQISKYQTEIEERRTFQDETFQAIDKYKKITTFLFLIGLVGLVGGGYLVGQYGTAHSHYFSMGMTFSLSGVVIIVATVYSRVQSKAEIKRQEEELVDFENDIVSWNDLLKELQKEEVTTEEIETFYKQLSGSNKRAFEEEVLKHRKLRDKALDLIPQRRLQSMASPGVVLAMEQEDRAAAETLAAAMQRRDEKEPPATPARGAAQPQLPAAPQKGAMPLLQFMEERREQFLGAIKNSSKIFLTTIFSQGSPSDQQTCLEKIVSDDEISESERLAFFKGVETHAKAAFDMYVSKIIVAFSAKWQEFRVKVQNNNPTANEAEVKKLLKREIVLLSAVPHTIARFIEQSKDDHFREYTAHFMKLLLFNIQEEAGRVTLLMSAQGGRVRNHGGKEVPCFIRRKFILYVCLDKTKLSDKCLECLTFFPGEMALAYLQAKSFLRLEEPQKNKVFDMVFDTYGQYNERGDGASIGFFKAQLGVAGVTPEVFAAHMKAALLS